MISARIFSTSVFSALLIALAACNNSGQTSSSQSSDTTSTSSATTPASTTPASSIVTTPENILVIMHKVANYAKWKPMYDGHDTARQAAGLHDYVIGRGVQDSNMVLVALKVDDTAKAKTFSKDPKLKQAMQKAGVVGAPTINLLTAVYQDTSQISTPLRSSSMFTVKDWDTWEKNFKDGEQERKDNGVMVRVYGHDASDNHKVRVVTALLDSAKAMAYFNSDALKKRRQASGVVGDLNRFIYRIVQRY
jgi:hypothetical protein